MNQQNKLPKYKFYGTLLDAFTWYLKSEKDEAFQEFLDKINRAPFSSEAADKGTAFNELVDSCTLELKQFGALTFQDNTISHNGFEFPSDLVGEYAMQFENAVPQVYVEKIIETKYGPVLLYGYVDELELFKVYDIKTTKQYDFGKYINNWQHKVYLYCLKDTGIDTFQYMVTDFEHIYKEEYVWRDAYELDLRLIAEQLICFLEDNRGLITDKKVFAKEEAIAL